MAAVLKDIEGRVINYRSFEALKVRRKCEVVYKQVINTSAASKITISLDTMFFGPDILFTSDKDKEKLRMLVPENNIEKVYMTEHHKINGCHIMIFGYGK